MELGKLLTNDFMRLPSKYTNYFKEGHMTLLFERNINGYGTHFKEPIQLLKDTIQDKCYIGKVLYFDDMTLVYAVIPISIKERRGVKLVKKRKFVQSIFDFIPEKFVIKSTNSESYTEYETLSFQEIIKLLDYQDINKLKSTMFYEFHGIDKVVDLIKRPNTDYKFVKVIC